MLKKLLSVILSFIMVALLFVSAFSVSALSPPYSKSFETQSEMLSSLSEYSESFPEVEDYFAGDLSAPREGYHLENREVIIPVLSAEGYTANAFSYAESSWGKGVDYSFVSYLNSGNDYTWRFMTYYSLNEEELSDSFDVGFKPAEGYIGDYKYIAYDSYSEFMDYQYTVCKVIVADCLVVIYGARDFYEKLDAIQFVSPEIEIPVYVKDAFEYPEVAEGCNRYFFYMPKSWECEYSQEASIFWWEGTGCMTNWPGVKANKGDAEGLYYYDVPKDVTTIMWANNMDSTLSYPLPEYKGAKATRNIGTEFYYPGESELYPDGVESFHNMVYVIDIEECSDDAGRPAVVEYYGEWYYYYGNGEYGVTKEKGDTVYTQRHFGERDYYFSLPDVADGFNRYFFYMPDEFYNESATKGPGIYWNNKKSSSDEFPGTPLIPTYVESLYYYDVPASVDEFKWTNLFDGGEDVTNPGYVDELTVSSTPYTADENFSLSDCNGMVFVVDFNRYDYEDETGRINFKGLWFYYYGNGEYGTTPVRGDGEIYTDKAFGLLEPQPPVFPYYVRLGDADGSGKVDIRDATIIQKVIAGIQVKCYGLRADVDASGKMNVKDATAIQKYLAGIETGYPIGELIEE